MTRRLIAAAALIAATLAVPAAAQETLTNETLLCRTSDGLLQITRNAVLIHDHVFTIDRVLSDGSVQLTDTRSHATALLELQGNEGIYLAVNDGRARMQIVADRRTVTTQQVPAFPRPSAVNEAPATTPDLRTIVAPGLVASAR